MAPCNVLAEAARALPASAASCRAEPRTPWPVPSSPRSPRPPQLPVGPARCGPGGAHGAASIMRALPSPLLLLLLLAPGAWASVSIPLPEQQQQQLPQPQPPPPVPPRLSPGSGPENVTQLEGEAAGGGSANRSETLVTRISSMLRDLPTLKAAVIVACAFTSFLIACLLLRVFRSGKRIKKTRKYDIITTPAERVEMAPLNEEDDDEEDSTVFDVKYR